MTRKLQKVQKKHSKNLNLNKITRNGLEDMVGSVVIKKIESPIT